MPVEVGIWKMGDQLKRIEFSSIESEAKLEDQLISDITVIAPNLLLVGSQVTTAYGKFIDLLAMDDEGNLVVVELKKNKTPREIVAQAIDYASWVKGLSHEDITQIYEEKRGGSLEEGFAERFGEGPPEEINRSHRMVIVCSELDASTERIIGYLNDDYGVPINVVFFQHFRDVENNYLTRSWLIDPTDVKIPDPRKEIWNGRDFYVSFGDGENRNWDDARRYGFISGGGGKWYWRTLENLRPGHRVFVHIPKKGFVGVGEVQSQSMLIRDYEVEVEGKQTPFLQAPIKAKYHKECADDEELCEHFVEVKWIKDFPEKEAYWEKGMFANTSTACKLRNRFTLGRLMKHFNLEE